MFTAIVRWLQSLFSPTGLSPSTSYEDLVRQNEYLNATCHGMLQSTNTKQWSLEVPVTDEMKEKGRCWLCFTGSILEGPVILLNPPTFVSDAAESEDLNLPTPDWKVGDDELASS